MAPLTLYRFSHLRRMAASCAPHAEMGVQWYARAAADHRLEKRPSHTELVVRHTSVAFGSAALWRPEGGRVLYCIEAWWEAAGPLREVRHLQWELA